MLLREEVGGITYHLIALFVKCPVYGVGLIMGAVNAMLRLYNVQCSFYNKTALSG